MNKFKQNLKRRIDVSVLILLFAAAVPAAASEITAEKMIDLTNDSRKEAGLKALTPNELLTLAAQGKAEDMFTNQYFEHVSPEGVTPWYWIRAAGYEYIYAAENLAIDFVTAEGAHNALMRSPGHRENILGLNYKEIGVAVLSGLFGEKISIIIVEEFGSSRKNDKTEAFFETPAPMSTVEVLEVEKTEPESPARPIETTVPEPEPEPEPIPASGETEPADVPETAPTQIDAAREGKIAPRTYSLDTRALKKVYVENIYWKKDRGDTELANTLRSDRARLKAFLRQLTAGRCCSGIDK